MKRKNWKSIFLPMIIFLFAAFGVYEIGYVNKIDFLEAMVSNNKGEVSLATVFNTPVSLEQKTKEIAFSSHDKTVKTISSDRLNIGEVFNIPLEYQNDQLIHAMNILEYPQNVFYFLISTTWSCGASNCTWAFYSYNANKDILKIIDNAIFGVAKPYLSPDKEKLALISYTQSGYCNGSSDIDLIDLRTLAKENVTTRFELETYTIMHMSFLEWISNNEIRIKISHRDCSNLSNPVFEEIFVYNIETKSAELKSKKKLPAS